MNQFGAASLLLAVILLFPPCVPAQVTLSFDNDLEGFTATTGGIEHAAQGGGRIMMTSKNGWGGNTGELRLQDNQPFRAEFERALPNDGTLSFDVTILAPDYDPADAPQWFEFVLNANSELDGWGVGVIVSPGFDFSTLQADGSQTRTISFQLAHFNSYQNLPASNWANIHIGTNTDPNIVGNGDPGGNVIVTYIDNFRIDGTPLPPGVVLTFDSDTEGFIAQGAGASVEQSPLGGGGMKITGPGGYLINAAVLDLPTGTDLGNEFETALLNGGYLCFDVSIYQNDQIFVDPAVDSSPNWFELIVSTNTDNGNDTNVIRDGIYSLSGHEWPFTSDPVTFPVRLPISGTVQADSDNIIHGSPGSASPQILIGLNNEGSVIQSTSVHLDNFAIRALTPLVRPKIEEILHTEGEVILTWSDEIEGATYMVQWSETMFPTEWTTLVTRWPGKTFQDVSFLLGPTGFYRVIRE